MDSCNEQSLNMSASKRRKFNPDLELTPELVVQYLKQNPEVLDHFIANHVNTDRIDRWRQRKTAGGANSRTSSSGGRKVSRNGDPKNEPATALTRWKTKLQTSKERLLQELTKDFHNANGKLLVLAELAECVAAAISADAHTLFTCDDSKQEITQVSKSESGEIVFGVTERMGLETSLAASVASTKESARRRDILDDKRYPEGLTVSDNRAQSVLGLPVMDERNDCLGVIEFYRHAKDSSFSDEEEEVAALLLQWYDMLLDYVEIHSTMSRQRTLNDFLLEVTRSIFQDIVSMDIVIMKIMNFAKALVHADRTSLFLLDTRSHELYARIFDDGFSLEEQTADSTIRERVQNVLSAEKKVKNGGESGEGDEEGEQEEEEDLDKRRQREEWRRKTDLLQQDIRFSMDKGVAGYVASTGKILNIPDAYKDSRFNREVDIQTGYKTQTILCMPIFIRGQVIGVVQMVNKLSGTFTKADEEAFETFAVYCGLALHHAKLYEKIRRSEQKYKVALDVLSYHSQATPSEVKALKSREIPENIENITRYNFSPWAVMDDDKPMHVLYMFSKLFNKLNLNQYEKSFDLDAIVRFTLTVRKNYRNVPYHNWIHAFSVAHSMYTIIETTEHKLKPIENIALFVSCLCHDLDHRGKTNSFMVQSASPLAAIYTTSTMEHHHFNQTVSILQNEDHNIFKFLSSDEYKQVLGEIKASILATDLVVFFKNKGQLQSVLQKNEFQWGNLEHRNTATGVMMTACDLCAMYKPWSIQHELVYIIMEEFWQQGDEEKKRGITPVEMMDRMKKDALPQMEVGFIESICVPCYELMSHFLPNTHPMLEGAMANLSKWKTMANDVKKKDGSDV